MTLAEREMADAMRRLENQKVAEADVMTRPRRYEQLERDRMEDDAELVDASVALDRNWDEWKEENPISKEVAILVGRSNVDHWKIK